MAIMIPESCPSRATAGEKRTFAMLRDRLPGEFTAWFEPVVRGRYPDFTLLAPGFGLLVLEVKGWRFKQITRANDSEVDIRWTDGDDGSIERLKHPIRQVRDYHFALMGELKRPELAILRQPEGEHLGKLAFPCGYGVVFTHIFRGELDEAGLSPLFPPGKVLCREEFAAMEAASDGELVQRLGRFFSATFPFDPLSEDQIRTIKGVLHKDVIVKVRPATAASTPDGRTPPPEAVVFDVLDAGQEQAARALGGGHHVLFGVAGSGKTALIVARARRIADDDPGKRVLVLCYNKVLASSLAAQVNADRPRPNVEVRSILSWVMRVTGLSRGGESWEDFEALAVATLLGGLGEFREGEKYDAILIDEAHDFKPDWFRCVVGMLRGVEDGDLLIAVDGAQSLYGRDRKFTWKSVGVRAQGRSRRLSRNYRNTKQILEFAWQVAQSPESDGEESETHVRVLPTKAARRGTVPRHRGCVSFPQEHELIARLVDEFKALGLAEREIAVLYPQNLQGGSAAFTIGSAARAGSDGSRTRGPPTAARAGITEPGVRLLTIHAAKGLEFPAVIVSAADQLPSPFDPDELRDRNLLYVGLTRAVDHLVVTWTGRSSFTERITRASKGTALIGL